MNRRRLLGLLGTSGVFLSGCMGIGQNSGPTTQTTSNSTPEPNPQITWSEEWLQGTRYSVTVTVQLNGASRVMIKQGTPSGNTIATLQSSGEHTVAGPNASRGPIEVGRTLFVVRPAAAENIDTKPVGSYMVGSQEQTSFPLHLRGLHGSTDPNLQNSGTLSRTYEQNTDSGPTSLSLQIPRVLYEYYKGRRRVRQYGAYVSDTYDDRYIDGIVSEFEDYGSRQGLSDFEIINEMMQFVQNLEYTSDQVSAGYNEYPKYPVETLVDQEGDCEDSCILLASMLEQFGYGAVLLIFRDKQHMALGIAGDESVQGTYFETGGQRYYYVETTAPGWGVGDLPPDMEGGSPTMAEINDNGVLVFSYAVDTPSSGGAQVEVTMKNVGDATGRAQAIVEFQSQSGSTVASASSGTTNIQPNGESTKTVRLAPPDGQTLRARVAVKLDGTVQDVLTSEYRDPIQE